MADVQSLQQAGPRKPNQDETAAVVPRLPPSTMCWSVRGEMTHGAGGRASRHDRALASRSAGDVKLCVGPTLVEARDQVACVFCGDGREVYIPPPRLLGNLGHDRQRAVEPGADEQLASPPGEFLVGRQWRVPELASIWPRGFFGFRTRPPSMTMSWS